ncbi:MAG: MotA/TolQ/ExbB proton channel family protein [Planctomycetaceae bacterium]
MQSPPTDLGFQIRTDDLPAGKPATTPSGPSPAAQPGIRTTAAPRPAATEEFADATEVSPWLSLGGGLAFTVAFYAIAFVLKNTYFGALFLERGWVQYALVFLLGWSGAILVLKSRKLALQRDSMLFDLLPEEISKEITVKSVDKFTRHIDGLPVRHGESFLINRVRRGLEHYQVLQNSSDVGSRLSVQSDVDANAVGASYSLVKVFIWAIPILGFIGTVIGISAAVGGFSGGLADATDINALKDSLGGVTGGLSTAFDTTLVALVFSMFVMFPVTSMQKSEEDVLNRVDEYVNENLLKRLHDGGKPATDSKSGVDPKALQAAIDSALVPHQAELKAWSKKLETIGEQLSKQVQEGWSKADEQLQARHQQTVKQIGKSGESLAELSTRLQKIADVQSETMTNLGEKTVTTQTEIAQSMQSAAESLQQYFAGLEQGLESLNRVLGSLGEKQVVVQMQPAPRKRGWGIFGGNGR